ncbi:M15 family metallopeptidase [Actinoplanes sp. NPDC051859]|uniref:M15 family metallopeptidase n=1 Tax=Actinoplanes sp. NPDC051859 TaxID=3363909 RepID=UPI00378BA5F8
MKSRPHHRPARKTRRPFATAAAVAVAASALTATAAPATAAAGPAEPPATAPAAPTATTPDASATAVPQAAKKWSSLMYHSLTPTPAYVQLRTKLATQRTNLRMYSTRITQGRAAHATALAELTAAVAADAAARTAQSAAVESLATARNKLTVVTQQRPRNAKSVAASRDVVLSAAKIVTARRADARTAAATLKTALAASSSATSGLDRAVTGWRNTSAAILTNQQRLIALDKSAELAGQAAALSRNVVAEVRTTFKTADTTQVNGVTVHRSVAFSFRRMLADAKSDGVVLSGGGFRTREQQIRLRKANGCPDVWKSPASSCRVPTAIPGQSLHELGLAVDITADGRSLSADTAGFRWLSAHAARYGFVNLPSEAWHWSITGG